MTPSHEIRGNFIRSYAEQHAKMWRESLNVLDKRDQELKSLNKKFEYPEPDGTFGIGRKSYQNTEYKNQYDKIESQFSAIYKKNLPAFEQWCQSQGITIYEYLLMDNIEDTHLERIARISQSKEDWELRPISLKAQFLIEKIKEDYYIGDIQKRLHYETFSHKHARCRCRKFFKIRPWNILDQKAIMDYARNWKVELKNAFYSLSAS